MDPTEAEKHAVTIQSSYRGYKTRKALATRQAEINGNENFETTVESDDEVLASGGSVQDEQMLHDNAVLIQSSFRGYKTRKRIMNEQNEQLDKNSEQQFETNHDKNATVIQSAYRGYEVRKSRHQAVEMESVSGSEELDGDFGQNEVYLDEKAVIIQSAYRGYAVRKQRKQENQEDESATVIQSSYRGYVSRQERESDRQQNDDSATVIQSSYRGYVVRKQRNAESQKRDESAILIQSTYRGYVVRKEIKSEKQKRDQSATVIQSSYRGYVVRKNQQNVPMESSKSPEHADEAENFPEDNLAEKEQAAIVIQSAYRGYQARKVYKTRKITEVKGQDGETLEVIEEVTNEVVIEQYPKEYSDGEGDYWDVDAKDTYATHVQAGVKGYLARRDFADEEEKRRQIEEHVTVIQSSYRGYKVRRDMMAERESADVIHGAARAYHMREKMQKDNENATILQATAKVFSADFSQERSDIEQGMYSDEGEGARASRSTKKSTAEKFDTRASKRTYNVGQTQTDTPKPVLGGRKFTEYIDHSSWLARHDSKSNNLTKEPSALSTVSSQVSRRKERHRKPLFMLRSMTVSGADPTQGFGVMKTSKEIQVQDSDFSRQNSRLELSRKTTEISLSDLDNPLKESKKYRKTPIPKHLKPYLEENSESENERVRKNPNANKYASNRHHSDLNAVAEEPEDEKDNEEKTDKVNANQPMGMPPPPVPGGPMGFGYFNPFEMQGNNQSQYPYPPPAYFYPPMNTPYGTWYPYWGNFGPYQNGQTGQNGQMYPHPGDSLPGSKEKRDKKIENNGKVKDSGKNFLKENKRDAGKDVAEKRPKYKDIAARRERLNESEEHGDDVRGSDDEDMIQTHATVKDDNRVKVDINLNISGRQLASMLGIDEQNLPYSPRNQFYPPPPMYPMFGPPPPMFGNVSSRTVPEIQTNRNDKHPEAVVSSSAPKAKKTKQSETQPVKTTKATKNETPGKNTKLNPYPVVPPIKTNGKQPIGNKNSETHIPFSEKREIEYKPHTLESYRKLDLKVKLPATLGPDWVAVEKVAEGKRRQEKYSDSLRKQHEVTLMKSNKFPKVGETQNELLSKTEVHNEYIKSIPKPHVYYDY